VRKDWGERNLSKTKKDSSLRSIAGGGIWYTETKERREGAPLSQCPLCGLKGTGTGVVFGKEGVQYGGQVGGVSYFESNGEEKQLGYNFDR